MLRANFSNFLNSLINPIDVDKDDYVQKGEAYVAEMTGTKRTSGVPGPIDSDKFANGVSEPAVNIRSGDLTNINSVNPDGLATRNSIKGKRQICDGVGVKKDHAGALKKHKYYQPGCDRDLTNKMLCPRRKLENIKGWKNVFLIKMPRILLI